MEELKEHIQHAMLFEFKNNKNATKTGKTISSVYGQCVIIVCQVQNWFSVLFSSDTALRDESRPRCLSDLDQDALREVEYNQRKSTRELALDLKISPSTIYDNLKKIGKVSNLHV